MYQKKGDAGSPLCLRQLAFKAIFEKLDYMFKVCEHRFV